MAKAAGYGLGLACFALVAAMAGATQFTVGGKNGWSVAGASAESLNSWAMKNRFKIGDTLGNSDVMKRSFVRISAMRMRSP
jgi:hypothetical protein